MLKLIKLEFKKNQFNGGWLGVLIVNIAIMGIVALMYFDPGALENEVTLPSYLEAFTIIDSLIRGAFIVYAAVWIAKLVIDEYKNKTMSLMFTYPINRKKLIAAKLVIVSIWTFLAIVISNLVISSALVLLNSSFGYISGTLEMDMLFDHTWKTLLNAVAAAGLSLIPLAIGMWKKSVPGTIISSVLLVSIIGSSSGGSSLGNIIAIPLALAAVGIIIAYISIRNVDKVDLI